MSSLFSRLSFWLCLSALAFVCLPSTALQYGIFDATLKEWQMSMGWQSSITWLWFLPLAIFPFLSRIHNVQQRSRYELAMVVLQFLLIFLSAYYFKLSLGYSTLVLFATLFVIAVQALARLNYLQGEKWVIGALALVMLTLAVFILYPTVAVFITMWQEGNPFEVLQQDYLLQLLWNSLSVSLTVGVLSTFFGLAFALYTTRIASKRTQFIGKILSILPIVTPPFVVSLGVTLMLGRSGYITTFLVEHFGIDQSWLYGFAGIAISHTLALTPMAFMMLEGAIKVSNVSLEEASYTLRGSAYQTLIHILLPLLKPALANAFLVVMVQSLADFSTPFVLGGNYDVLASQIYFYIVGTQSDYAAASSLGTILLSFSLLIFLIQYYWLGRYSYVTLSGKQVHSQQQPLPQGLRNSIILLLVLWGSFTLLLYGSIFFGSFTVNWGVDNHFTLDNYLKLFGQGLDQGGFPSLIQTLLYALCAAPITAALGLLMAYLFTRVSFLGKQTLEFMALLSFAVPGTVAGLAYVLAFNHSPIFLTGTSAIIVLSMITRNMPIGMRACMAGMKQIDQALDEASLTLGANRWQTLRFIVLPLLKHAFLSALVTSFVRSMTTISAIIFLVSPSTRVATSYILNRVEDGAYGLAVAYGSTLIIVMLIVIFLFNFFIKSKKF